MSHNPIECNTFFKKILHFISHVTDQVLFFPIFLFTYNDVTRLKKGSKIFNILSHHTLHNRHTRNNPHLPHHIRHTPPARYEHATSSVS